MLARPMDRQKILTGNALASSTAEILHTAHISSCPWGVENGANSRLWHHPEFEALARFPYTHVRTTCMCQHGATHKQITKVLLGHVDPDSACHLLSLKCTGRRGWCSNGFKHVVLEGAQRTSAAQVYPMHFAQQAAELLATAIR